MATAQAGSKTKKTTSTRKTTTRAAASNAKAETTSEEKVAQTATEEKAAAQKITPKRIDDTQYVTVRNGFQGTLVYRSPRTGELFIWDSFGDRQDIELRELKNAKSAQKKMFENNWFMFDDEEDWVVDYLGIRNYYRNALDLDHFDDVFDLPADKLKERLGEISEGQKRSVAYRAYQLISEGKIDSLATIHVLEDMLGIELIED